MPEFEPVALATLLLAGSTFWLALEARRSRRDAAEQRDREAVRAGLLELADALARWVAWAPVTGSLAFRMPDEPIDLPACRRMITVAAVPDDVLAYLRWSLSAIRDESANYLDALNDRIPAMDIDTMDLPGWATDEAQGSYRATIEHIAATAQVILKEARRRGFTEIVTAFAPQFRQNPDPDPEDPILGLAYELEPPPLPKG